MIAAISQIKTEKKAMPAVLMVAGSVILISAAVCNLAGQQLDYILALVGCTAICVAAIYNGMKSGNFHLQHHIIRIILSLVLTIGFILL